MVCPKENYMLIARFKHRVWYLTFHAKFRFGYATYEYDGLWTVVQIGFFAITYGR